MQNIENKEYYTLLGLTKQERNDIIIIYETIRNRKWKVREHEEKSLCSCGKHSVLYITAVKNSRK